MDAKGKRGSEGPSNDKGRREVGVGAIGMVKIAVT
jgi:hypothetical protein